LKFVQPGKFVQRANQERAKAQLERLKQEIAEQAKLAGVQTEIDIPDSLLKVSKYHKDENVGAILNNS
jgi:hypothetical protein